MKRCSPTPTAEQLFAGAWSACYIAALGLAAKELKVAVPADLSVEIEVDLGMAGADYFLQGRIHVNLPGVAQEAAEAVAHPRRCHLPVLEGHARQYRRHAERRRRRNGG